MSHFVTSLLSKGVIFLAGNPHEKHRSRVRLRFSENGLDGFAHHEVLELLLYYCYPRRDTNEIAHRMLKEFGSLPNLFEADVQEIVRRCKVTSRVATLINLIPRVANLYMRSRLDLKVVMDNVNTAAQYAVSQFVGRTNEAFYVFCLDTGFRLKGIALIAEGTLDETAVYPRIIVEEALKYQAKNLIFAHNHPGGTIKPSRNDINSTRKIMEGLNILNIRLIDHIIVAGDKHYSFAKHGQIVEGY